MTTTAHAQEIAEALELVICAVQAHRSMLLAVNKIRRELDPGTACRIAFEAQLLSTERSLECAIAHAQGVLTR